MTIFARGSRAGALLLGALLLVLAPGVAFATFTGARSAPLQVSTATMVAPASVAGTYACTRTSTTEGITMSVTGFTDAGPAGATYVYTLKKGSTLVTTTTSANRSASLTGSQPRDLTTTTWTVGVQAKLGAWTSAVTSKSIACTEGSRQTGNL